MHPRLYPFVVNGPDCACTDPRVAHVRTNKYGLWQADLGCSACDLCECYTPLEAVDHEAEGRVLDEIREEETRRRQIHTKVTYGVLVGVLISLPAVAIAPELFPWLMLPVVGTGLVNMAIASRDAWRRGDLDTNEASLQVTLVIAVLLLFLALAIDASPVVLSAVVAAIVMLGFALAMIIRRQMTRAQRALRAIATDLENRDDPP